MSHGGVAIYLNNKFSYRKPELNHDSNVYDNLTIEIWQEDFASSKYLISSIYRPPTHSVEDLKTFTNEFSTFLKIIHRRYRKGYINGDSNINLLKINENNNYNSFYESVISEGFMPQITLPTHLSDTSHTLLDNTLTNYYEITHKSGVLSMPISDHQMTFTTLVGTTLQATNKQLIELEKVNNRAIENFKADLASCNMYDRMNYNLQQNPNTNYDILSDILTELKVKHMPKKIRKFNKRKEKKDKRDD